jgi:predicted AlkP superfamily phosphohydrolase/phosphomutase
MATPRLTVIGLDAATLDVIEPLAAAGDLPNLARLFESGSFGRLRSTTHPLTPQAWATMVTGVNAARHGLWDFSQRDEGGYGLTLVNGSFRRAPALWDHLVAAGLRVGLVNVPFTWPAPDVDDGFVIAGLDASERDDGMTHPPELLHELRRRFGRLEVDHSFPLDETGEIDLDQVRRVCEQRVAVTQWLAEGHDLDLLFVVFMAADHIHHLAGPEWEGPAASPRSTASSTTRSATSWTPSRVVAT